MIYDLILIANIVLYIAALVLVYLARRWEETEDQFTRWAGIVGLVAGIGTLATNVLVVTGPDLFEATGQWGLLLLSVAVLPTAVIVGSVLTLRDRRGGVPTLVISSSLWLVVCIVGVGVTLNGGF